MKLAKAEWIAILVTLTLLSFAAGFFFGRSTVPSTVTVQGAVPAVSPYQGSTTPEPAQRQLGSAPEAETPAVSAEESAEVPEYPIDLNTATLSQLETLPEIGPVLAQRILDYRNENGSFTSVDELKSVSGIGDKTYDAIMNLVEVVN